MVEAELGGFVQDEAGAIVQDEAEVRALAEALGLALPAFTQQQHTEPFAAWADRVAFAESLRARGRLTSAALDECDRQLGLPSSRSAPPQLGWGRDVDVESGWSGREDEVLRAIEDAIAAGVEERAP